MPSIPPSSPTGPSDNPLGELFKLFKGPGGQLTAKAVEAALKAYQQTAAERDALRAELDTLRGGTPTSSPAADEQTQRLAALEEAQRQMAEELARSRTEKESRAREVEDELARIKAEMGVAEAVIEEEQTRLPASVSVPPDALDFADAAHESLVWTAAALADWSSPEPAVAKSLQVLAQVALLDEHSDVSRLRAQEARAVLLDHPQIVARARGFVDRAS